MMLNPLSGPPRKPDALDQWLSAYADGEVEAKQVEAATGLWFGDMLVELRRRGLRLPQVDSTQHFSPAQHQLFLRLFS